MRNAGLRNGIIAFAAVLLAAGMVPRVAAASAAMPPACTTPPVSAPAGKICGLALTVKGKSGTVAVYVYKGIRYGIAKRWTAAVLAPPAAAPVEATAFGPICPQDPIPGIVVPQSEDCLFLNIWTPTRNSARNLPVMVFIHGGSFTSGAGQLPVYSGARLAGWGGVVVVTINYRLGALGFLAGGTGFDALAGNYGFRDQQLALQWVRRNIRSFGGAPDNVTIFGESAGAMSVGAHLLAPTSRPLFRSAIMESNPYGIPLKTPGEASNIRLFFDYFAGCEGRGLACLEKRSAAEIVAAQDATDAASVQTALLTGQIAGILAWAPYVDDQLIGGQPNKAAIAQPVIAGTNRDEGPLFVYPVIDKLFPKGLDDSAYTGLVESLFGKNNGLRILAQPRSRPNGKDNSVPLSRLFGDYFFSCATRHVLAGATGPHFGYVFFHPPSYPVWPQAPKVCQPGGGAVCHGFELPFVFRNPVTLQPPVKAYSFTPAEQKMVDRISAYWTDFARDGDPNSGAATPPAWPAFGAKGVRQVLNSTISQTRDNALDCPFWDSIGYGQGATSLY